MPQECKDFATVDAFRKDCWVREGINGGSICLLQGLDCSNDVNWVLMSVVDNTNKFCP